jgi:hypothetical protein
VWLNRTKGKEIPECDSESIEINDMIDLLPKVLKSLEDVGQKESFLKFMGLIASGTFPHSGISFPEGQHTSI